MGTSSAAAHKWMTADDVLSSSEFVREMSTAMGMLPAASHEQNNE
jgi:hypothetical protein